MNHFLVILLVLVSMILSVVVYAITQQVDAEAEMVSKSLVEENPEPLVVVGPHSAQTPMQLDAGQPGLEGVSRRTRSHVDEAASLFQFNLAEHSAKKAPLQLRIEAEEGSEKSWIGKTTITFENTSEGPVQVVKPLDGSFYGWFMPHYQFSVLDGDGNPLELMGRCGNCGLWADTQWPSGYVVEIAAGDTLEIQGHLPVAVPADGEYTVSMKYIYRFEDDVAPAGKANAELAEPVQGVWQGTLESEPINMKLNKNTQ